MVEAQPVLATAPTASDDNSNVNIDQLVHLKAYQTGYLTFDKNFIDVPGYVYGSSKKLHQFDDCSAFLPYEVGDMR